MKNKAWIVLTLINFAVTSTLLMRRAPVAAAAMPAATSLPDQSGTAKSGEPAGAPLTSAILPVQPSVTPATFHWRQIESPDYRVYIQNLRAIGCPESTLCDIIAADVQALF